MNGSLESWHLFNIPICSEFGFNIFKIYNVLINLVFYFLKDNAGNNYFPGVNIPLLFCSQCTGKTFNNGDSLCPERSLKYLNKSVIVRQSEPVILRLMEWAECQVADNRWIHPDSAIGCSLNTRTNQESVESCQNLKQHSPHACHNILAFPCDRCLIVLTSPFVFLEHLQNHVKEKYFEDNILVRSLDLLAVYI